VESPFALIQLKGRLRSALTQRAGDKKKITVTKLVNNTTPSLMPLKGDNLEEKNHGFFKRVEVQPNLEFLPNF
jgi:hypothetical protein